MFGIMRTWAVPAALLLAMLPLALFTYIPATDLPSHVAISSILVRLLSGDATTQLYYAFNPQPIPYYLAYAVLAPCVALAGPGVGPRLAMACMALLFMGATHRLGRAAGLPPWTVLAAPFLFYGPLFFWGFVSTLVGVPFVLLCAAQLLLRHRQGKGHAVLAAAFAGLACLGHVVLALPLALCVGAYGWLAPRARWPLWVGAAGFLTVCCLDMAVHSHLSQYETVDSAWHHIKTHLGPFDKGAGRAAHVLFVLGLAGLNTLGPSTPARRFGRVLAVGSLAVFVLCPVDLRLHGQVAWGLNFRFLTLAEAGLLLGVAPAAPPFSRYLAVGLTTVFMTGVGWLWWQFDAAAQPLQAVLQQLPAGSKVQARVAPVRFAQAWPPLSAKLVYYFLAGQGGYEDSLFAGGHIPIRELVPPQGGEAGRMGEFDYVLEQDVHGPAPQDGSLAAQTARWRLYRHLD